MEILIKHGDQEFFLNDFLHSTLQYYNNDRGVIRLLNIGMKVNPVNKSIYSFLTESADSTTGITIYTTEKEKLFELNFVRVENANFNLKQPEFAISFIVSERQV